MKQWDMNRLESSNTVCAENTKKRLEPQLKTIKLYNHKKSS